MSEVPEDVKKELLEYPFVNAVGPGVGRGERHKNDEHAVVAFVRRKKAESDLDDDDVLPKEIDGTKVDVQEIGKLEIENVKVQKSHPAGDVDTTSKHRPAPQGVSIGHPDVTAGTSGFIAWEEVEKNGVSYPAPRGVTNNHVGANSNRAEVGDNILQPGPLDRGQNTDAGRIGELEGYVEIKDEDNLVDCAWFSIDGRKSNSYVPGIGVPDEAGQVSVGDTVRKFGQSHSLNMRVRGATSE